MPSDSQPVTEEMVEAALAVILTPHAHWSEYERSLGRRALEAAQAVAPTKVINELVLARALCGHLADCDCVIPNTGLHNPCGVCRTLASEVISSVLDQSSPAVLAAATTGE